MTLSFLVRGQDGYDQVIDHVPGEFLAEGAAVGHSPQHVRLDHFVR
jgi:hypothetical protein